MSATQFKWTALPVTACLISSLFVSTSSASPTLMCSDRHEDLCTVCTTIDCDTGAGHPNPVCNLGSELTSVDLNFFPMSPPWWMPEAQEACLDLYTRDDIGVCVPYENQGVAETANNVDDDCDGMTDECDPGQFWLNCEIDVPTPNCGLVEGTATCSSPGTPPGPCIPNTFGIEEIVNGLDDDCDGLVDNVGCTQDGDTPQCFLRFLFVPTCYSGDDTQFQTDTQAQIGFFLESTGLDQCPDSVLVEQIRPQDFSMSSECSPTYGFDRFPHEIRNRLETMGVVPEEWTNVIAYTDNESFMGSSWNPSGHRFVSESTFLLVRKIPTQFIGGPPEYVEYNAKPDHIFAHEFGHTLGLLEEYRVDNRSGPNPLSAELGCNIEDGTCCDDTSGPCSHFKGHLIRPELEVYGRCIMSHALADFEDAAPPTPRGWCQACWDHMTQVNPGVFPLSAPLTCDGLYEGNGPIISIIGTVNVDGEASGLDSVYVADARPEIWTPQDGALSLRLEDTNGDVIYEASFDVDAPGSWIWGKTENFEIAPIGLRAKLPPHIDPTVPLPIIISKDGNDVSQTTFNGSPPVADAGGDLIIECNDDQEGTVFLNGGGSFDPDGDIIRYEWTSENVWIENPEAAVPLIVAPIGTSEITLTVDDGSTAMDNDGIDITVIDSIPPQFESLTDIFSTTCTGEALINFTPPTVSDACNPSILPVGTITESNGEIVNIPIAGEAIALPIGEHVIVWTADDGFQQSSTTQTVVIQPGVFANGYLDLRDGAEVYSVDGGLADIFNAGSQFTQIGNDSASGSIVSISDVNVNHRATVEGAIVSSGNITVENDAFVSGPLSEGANISLPTGFDIDETEFISEGEDVYFNPQQSNPVLITPGSYGRVFINSGAVLMLEAGDYYFKELYFNSASTIILDNTAGEIRIYVESYLAFRGDLLNLYGESADVFVGFAGDNPVILEAPFAGMLIAPNTTIEMGTGDATEFRGVFYGQGIVVRPHTTLICEASLGFTTSG